MVDLRAREGFPGFDSLIARNTKQEQGGRVRVLRCMANNTYVEHGTIHGV